MEGVLQLLLLRCFQMLSNCCSSFFSLDSCSLLSSLLRKSSLCFSTTVDDYTPSTARRRYIYIAFIESDFLFSLMPFDKVVLFSLLLSSSQYTRIGRKIKAQLTTIWSLHAWRLYVVFIKSEFCPRLSVSPSLRHSAPGGFDRKLKHRWRLCGVSLHGEYLLCSLNLILFTSKCFFLSLSQRARWIRWKIIVYMMTTRRSLPESWRVYLYY